MDSDTMATISFWLRQTNAIQLFFCGFAMLWLYFKFHNRLLRRFCRWAITWFLLYGVARISTPWIDFYTNRGYGLSSLLLNIIFWLAPCIGLAIFIVKLKRGTISLATVSLKGDEFFESVFREIQDNTRRTDDLGQSIQAHLKGK